MRYSRYYAAATTNESGVLTHTVSNPNNINFGYLAKTHLEFRISANSQTLTAFTADIDADDVSALSLGNDYTLDLSHEFASTNNMNLTPTATYYLYVKRATPKLTHFVDFQGGAPLTEADLDNSNRYSLFREQEIEDDLSDTREDILAIPDQLSDDVSRLRTSFTTSLVGGQQLHDVTHNLGYHPVVQIFEGSTPGVQLDCEVTHVRTSVTRLTFSGSSPASATAEFR